MVQTRQPTIERAITLVEEEIKIVENELEAFERFLSRLYDVGKNEPQAMRSDGGSLAMATVETTPSEGLQTIREAYRETVMAVPHYEEEYGDTLRESMAVEFGETLAGYVADGTVITRPVYVTLVKATESAKNIRDNFLRQLRHERDSLQGIATDLNEIEACLVELDERICTATTSPQLASVDEELVTLERECLNLANRRQSTIHDRTTREISGVDDGSLAEYLYADMETITPALSDVATLIDSIQHQRERCLQ